MKYLYLLFIIACSSAPQGTSNKAVPGKELNQAFKKEKPLKNSDVTDFYSANIPSMSPALQDETLDRFTPGEASKLPDGDPLMELSLKCNQGDFKAAFALASKTFDRYQKVSTYWNLIGSCHLNQGNSRKALLFYNKALEVTPNYVPALNNIGVLYSRSQQDQKALVAFERATKESRFSKTPRYNLAKIYLKYGLADQALTVFQGLLESSPQDVDLLNSVATSYFFIGDYARSLAFYQKIPNQYWSNPEIGLNISLVLKKAGRTDDAIKIFNSVDKPRSEALSKYYSVVKSQVGA